MQHKHMTETTFEERSKPFKTQNMPWEEKIDGGVDFMYADCNTDTKII